MADMSLVQSVLSLIGIRERLSASSVPEPNSGCLLWTGRLSHGYGVMEIQCRRQRTHRVSYELAYGPIPSGLSVLHRCDTPACINPDHLFLGTIADNNHDMMAKGRHGTAAKPTCKHGHPLTAYPSGKQRYCKTCNHLRYLAKDPSRTRRPQAWRNAP